MLHDFIFNKVAQRSLKLTLLQRFTKILSKVQNDFIGEHLPMKL